MPITQDIFYSLPEVWDFCLEKIYDKKEYIDGLIELFKKEGISKKSLILDAGCGSGFPSIDLIERGYRVIGTDKSSEMVRQVQLNAAKRKVSIEAYNTMWANLAKQFGPVFDFVYCRGNSLVYAASWEQNWIVPGRSREEIERAIQNFYAVLKPGGKLYVDVTNKDEKPHKENIGIVKTKEGEVEIVWEIEHDANAKVRTWTIALRFLDSGLRKAYPSYSYLLSHTELVDYFEKARLKDIKEIKINGEKNYNVFLGTK
ncbi:MAG: class I SAM-dependent methyltransferase [Candidatus Sungbacteria bacterium]|uniref:Class I SAM-dependent methyltransferase n=1 Tax=Candidatus Sungiibacteriota bacterium TaxID=2750080 RepID=A0A9D6LQT7_9BACT|nr:class I SAM-dependent methyltransferase [Candidatus Sungbacteria bacterium]